jgi:hypothetical protein
VSGINAGLIQAVVTTGLVLALWTAIAIPATIVKRTLAALGLETFSSRAASAAQRLGVFGSTLGTFFEGLRHSARAVGEGASVELALDDRNRGLRATLKRSQHAIREAAHKVAGLEGANGPKHLVDEIQKLRQQTEAVRNIGADFDDDLADQYAAGAGARLWLGALLVGGLVIFFINGSLLAQFFRELFATRVAFGLTIGHLMAYAFVVAEIILGVCLGLAVKKANGVARVACVAAALIVGLVFASVEFVAFSALSANIDPEFYLLVDLPRSWLGPLGPAMVLLNIICGYFIHDLADQVVRHRGAKRLERELRAASDFARVLPQQWESIDAKARNAENSVQRYVSELGGQSDRMSGLVENMATERDLVLAALRGVQLDETVLAGKEGDASRATARAVGFFMLGVVWTFGCVLGLSYLLFHAFAAALPFYATVGLALLVAAGFAALGQVAYGRVQRLAGDRLQPLPTSPLSLGLTGVCLTAALVGICWVCATLIGPWGVLGGILLTALFLPLTVVGYHLPEATKGGMLVVTVLARFAVAVVSALFAVVRYVVLWLVAVFAWLARAILAVLAAPVELVIAAIAKARKPDAVPSTHVTVAASEVQP